MIVPALPVFDIKFTFTFTNKWILIPVTMVFGSNTSSLSRADTKVLVTCSLILHNHSKFVTLSPGQMNQQVVTS